jgi:hypothetical protein
MGINSGNLAQAGINGGLGFLGGGPVGAAGGFGGTLLKDIVGNALTAEQQNQGAGVQQSPQQQINPLQLIAQSQRSQQQFQAEQQQKLQALMALIQQLGGTGG